MNNLSKYVTNTDSDVYGLINLPEEVIAVLFAYYSRSSGSLKDNLEKLLEDDELGICNGELSGNKIPFAAEKARKFHEKWVLGYGHASVAEHAVAHIAVEKISILLSKVIEDSRLASFTEKSSRFVSFKNTDFYPLNELNDKELLTKYLKTAKSLMDDYSHAYDRVYTRIAKTISNDSENMDPKEKIDCKKQTCDVVRYFLPTATYTNLGLTANGRELAHIISKLLSNPLKESVECGKKIKKEGMKLIPTLIKYADKKSYLEITPYSLKKLSEKIDLPNERNKKEQPVILVKYQVDPEYILAASILYETKTTDFVSILENLKSKDLGFVRRIIDEYLKNREDRDQPLRNLEHIYYTFDILIDYGAFRDIQRHRIATQTNQLLSCDYGYSMPEEVEEFGLKEIFEKAMAKAHDVYLELKEYDPIFAQYILPLAFRKRVLFTWNLRELHHFITLRTSPAGHISYRKIANEIFNEIERVHPFLAKHIRVTKV
ncbi:FAD-dependent thymidylate synthase [bacterium]|nr:FAD-dependent thymidylate synthase [bacterium]